MKHSLTVTLKLFITHFFLLMAVDPGVSQTLVDAIRLNQIGFYPDATKIAVVDSEADGKFKITSTDLSKTYYTGQLSKAVKSKFSAMEIKTAEFPDFKREGIYVLYIPEYGYSYQFEICAFQFGLFVGKERYRIFVFDRLWR